MILSKFPPQVWLKIQVWKFTCSLFVTHWNLGSRKTKFYLPTSPEIHLKTPLLGWNQIFEIKSCYRDQEISSIHQPEFCC